VTRIARIWPCGWILRMFPAKAHGPTVIDFNAVGVDAACCHQAKEGLPLFMGMPLVTPPMNAIGQSKLCSTNL